MERLPRLEHQLALSKRSVKELEEEKATLHLQKEADQAEVRKKAERIAKLMGQVKVSSPEHTPPRGMCSLCYIVLLLWLLLYKR